ncbi:MAG TPA: tetratricopeptide repeat protein [Bryobacteraceae bacterium]|nr:tetratricopeptide repeat protein [Bryobacteraceae bacterium]
MRTRDVCLAILLVLGAAGLRGESVSPAPDPAQARKLNNLGSLYFDRGDYSHAEAAFSQAGTMGDPRAWLNLGATLRAEARFAEAEKAYRSALESSGREAAALYGLALVYRDAGRYSEAAESARRALDLSERAVPRDDLGMATALDALGIVAQSQGETLEALNFFRRALETAEGAPVADALKLAEILVNLGNTERLSGDRVSASTHLGSAVSLLKGSNARSARMAAALEGLALAARDGGDLRHARALAQRAVDLLAGLAAAGHPDYSAALSNLGLIHQDLRDFRKARELFLEALRIDRQTLGQAHPRLGTDLNNLGVVSTQLHDYANAETYFRQALAVDSRSVHAAFWMANLGGLYAREDRSDDALEFYRAAAALLSNGSVPADLRVAAVLEEYATLLRQTGHFAEAEDIQTKATRIRVKYVITNESRTSST